MAETVSEGAAHSARASIARGLAAALAFAVAFCAVCAGIGSALPFPDVPVVRTKLTHLAAHGGEYDTLFIGSSRIYYQVLPQLFDAATARAGRPTRSFNAGIAGMHPPEDGYVLEHILRHPPPGLRWVFIELYRIHTSMDAREAGTARAAYWHDWKRLLLVCRHALAQKPKKGSSARFRAGAACEEMLPHGVLFAKRAANLGRGAELLGRLRPQAAEARESEVNVMGERRDGWIRAFRSEEMNAAERADYTRRLEERRSAPARASLADRASQDALAGMVAEIERLGALPVLVVLPTTSSQHFQPAPAIASTHIVLNFSDVEKFAELFAPEHRFDTDHVNTEGSKLFTEALARRFIEERNQRP